MAFRPSLALALAALLAASAGAFAQTCPSSLPKQPAPDSSFPYKLHGRLVAEHPDANQLWLTDFDAGTSAAIAFNLSPYTKFTPSNPKFSPDGRWIVFYALWYSSTNTAGRHDIFVSTPSGALLTNLTLSLDGSHPYEDPSFTPDGTAVLFKSFYYPNNQPAAAEIVKMAVNLPKGNGVAPTPAGPPAAVSALLDDGHTEFSAPLSSPTGRFIFGFQGTTGPTTSTETIWRLDTLSNTLFRLSTSPNVQTYYPVPMGLTGTLFVNWPSASNRHDQINLWAPAVNTSPKVLPLNTVASDTSDPTVFDEDTIIYASDRCGDPGGAASIYKLFIGSVSTGAYWRLDESGVNAAAGQIRAPDYTPISKSAAGD